MDNFKWDSLIKDCFLQNYILVVGNDVMLDKSYEGGNLEQYLCERYREKILKTKTKRVEEFREFMKGEQVPLEISNRDLWDLLKLRFFRVVITTTVNDLLERLMRDIWGEQLQVVDFCDSETRNIFQPKGIEEFDFTKPTLCYAFGKAVGNNKFGYDEDDKLEIIADWLNPTLDRYPEALYRYIQTKKVLAIGCKLDDWLFRFFWYSLRRNVLTLKSNKYVDTSDKYKKGSVAIELNTDDREDEKLKAYLERNGLFFGCDAHAFVHDFLDKLTIKDNGLCMYKGLKSNLESRECFISYAHEDFDIAYHLYLALKDRGFSVWIDSQKLLPGSEYEQRINHAIDQCEVFLPVLSNTISNDFKNGIFDAEDHHERRYYLNEWERAMKCTKKKVIIPILCKGFDVSDDAYKHTPWYRMNKDRTFYKIETPFNLLIDGIRENGYNIKSSKTNE